MSDEEFSNLLDILDVCSKDQNRHIMNKILTDYVAKQALIEDDKDLRKREYNLKADTDHVFDLMQAR
jgi:hypothetical protein